MIRIANTQDIPQLKDLLIKLLMHHQQFHLLYKVDVEYQEEIAHFFSDVFANDHYRIYVADIENKLGGFIMCSNHIRPKYFTIKNKGRIDSIYVDSNYRN